MQLADRVPYAYGPRSKAALQLVEAPDKQMQLLILCLPLLTRPLQDSNGGVSIDKLLA